MQPALSWNSMSCHGTPSLMCKASSSLNTQFRKNCWSFSLAKLMLNCSNELWAKFSKPKISSSPTYGKAAAAAPPEMNSFTLATIQSNSFVYTALITASRAASACNLLKSIVYVEVRLPPPPRWTVRVVNSLVSDPQPSNASAASRSLALATSARSLSSWLKVTFPRSRREERIVTVSSCSRWPTPSFAIAPMVSCMPVTSETLGMDTH
mmetsp:Transcript_32408/g.85035  ORF Transcript_32408/g.85035 Transcript_32408/m.85035 type:complete len:209 (+) Transcript_32408:3642-4268(+)